LKFVKTVVLYKNYRIFLVKILWNNKITTNIKYVNNNARVRVHTISLDVTSWNHYLLNSIVRDGQQGH